jgi:hypothetical protein
MEELKECGRCGDLRAFGYWGSGAECCSYRFDTPRRVRPVRFSRPREGFKNNCGVNQTIVDNLSVLGFSIYKS